MTGGAPTSTPVLAITGTSTDVGKTIVTAALAAALRGGGARVAVCKPAQTGIAPGEPGDLAEVTRLAGTDLTTAECARYPEPLAPDVAARRAGAPYLSRDVVARTVRGLADDHDIVLVEGAGGVLVRLAPGFTLLDAAADAGASMLIVVDPALGTLNHTELTVDAVRARGLHPTGLVIGSWPDAPDLAMTCNRSELPALTGVPLVGVLPAGAARRPPAEFTAAAATWFEPDWLAGIRAARSSSSTQPTPAQRSNEGVPT